MFGALGDSKEQEIVRTKNPRKNHCAFLKESNIACIEFHKNMGDPAKGGAVKGEPCPHNPYVKNKDLYKQFQDYGVIYSLMEYLENWIVLDALPDLEFLSPAEVLAAVLIKKTHEFEKQQVFAGSQLFSGGLQESGKGAKSIDSSIRRKR